MHNKKSITVVKIGGNIIDDATELKQFIMIFKIKVKSFGTWRWKVSYQDGEKHWFSSSND
jgi:hypothetical protein